MYWVLFYQCHFIFFHIIVSLHLLLNLTGIHLVMSDSCFLSSYTHYSDSKIEYRILFEKKYDEHMQTFHHEMAQ